MSEFIHGHVAAFRTSICYQMCARGIKMFGSSDGDTLASRTGTGISTRRYPVTRYLQDLGRSTLPALACRPTRLPRCRGNSKLALVQVSAWFQQGDIRLRLAVWR
jgi:hypothetical protein